MKRISIGLAATLAAISLASAQTYLDSKGTVVPGVAPLVGCVSGGNCAGPVSSTNPLPVTGSLAATLSGFQPGAAYATPLSVSTTSSRVALPAGSVVVVYNTGAAAAYVQLGGSSVAATTSNDVVPAGGWMAYSVGSNAYLAAISSSGTTALNVSGGSGLPTGAGGGGAGASIPTGSAGSPNAAVVSVQGVSGGTAEPVSLAALPALAAGANTIGAVTQASGPWAVSWSAQTVAATQSGSWTIGGLGTAGTPSGGVVSIQGVSGGQALPVSGTFWQTTQPVSLSSLPALAAGSNAIGSVAQSGSTGADYSANKPTLPNVGANFAASGPYASYVLIATAAASPSRLSIDVENTSGAQIAIVLDDGAASSGSAPNNASVFALSAGSGAGAQGGSWVSQVEKGRVQVYAPASTAQVAIRTN